MIHNSNSALKSSDLPLWEKKKYKMFQRVSGQLREVSTVGRTYTRKICGANIKIKAMLNFPHGRLIPDNRQVGVGS